MPRQDDVLKRLTALYDLQAELREQGKPTHFVSDLIERLEAYRKPFK